MSTFTPPSPLNIARDRILAQDQGRLHKARASVVSLGDVMDGGGWSSSEQSRDAVDTITDNGSAPGVEQGELRKAASNKGVDEPVVVAGSEANLAMQDAQGPASSTKSSQPDQQLEASSLSNAIHDPPFHHYHDITSPQHEGIHGDAMAYPSISSEKMCDPPRNSFEPFIPARTSSVPRINSSITTPFTSMATNTTKPIRPKVKMQSSPGTGSGHSHSRSFQHLLSRSRSNSGSDTEDPSTPRGGLSTSPTGASLGKSLFALRSTIASGAGGLLDSEEEQITSLPPVPATLTDMDPERKKALVRRARKLEKLLGEALSESEVGEMVVDPSRGRSADGRPGNGVLGGMDGVIFPPARGIEDAEIRYGHEQETPRVHSHATDGGHKFRPRVSSEPELPSPTTGSFDLGADLITRPKSSLDYNDSESDRIHPSNDQSYRYYDHDVEEIMMCVDDSGASPGSWLKRVGSKLGGQIASNPQRLGRLGRGGSASSQKAIDKDLRDNGVRVLVKQEKIMVRTSYLDPSWLPSRSTQNRRISGMSAAARLAELKAARRHSSPISPTFGLGFIEQSQSFEDAARPQCPQRITSLAGLLSEDERRVKRAQLAKLHRLLGTRVPIELLLNTSAASSPVQEEKYDSSPLRPLQAVQQTLEAVPGLYEDMPMTPEQKARAVKRASKMISKFGSAPPVSMYLPESGKSATGQSAQDNLPDRAVTYRQSLISLQYLLDNDQDSLKDVLSDLMEESEEESGGKAAPAPGAGPVTPPKSLRRVSSTPSIRRSTDSRNDTTPTPPSPLSPDRSQPDDFILRRKRARKISKFFGEDNLGSGHLQEHVVPTEATRQSFGSKRSIMLDRVLEEIERGAEADKAQGLLDDGELQDVREHVYALRKSVSLKKLNRVGAAA